MYSPYIHIHCLPYVFWIGSGDLPRQILKKKKNTIFYEIKTFYLAFIGRKKLHQPVYGRVETSFMNLQRVSGATQLATLLAGKACGSHMFGFYMCFDMGFPLRHIVALIAGVAVVSVTVQHGVYQVIQC